MQPVTDRVTDLHTSVTSTTGTLEILSWNIEGLLSKFDYPNFLTYLDKFTFACLTETFVDYLADDIFQNFDTFVSPAKKLSIRGRRSGGVICLVKKQFSEFFCHVSCNYDNVVVFRVNRALLGTLSDVLLICVYIPPMGSTYYDTRDEKNGVNMLENCILDLLDKITDCSILLCGDFNARTGNMNTTESWQNADIREDIFVGTRASQDEIINEYGRSLLTLCASFDLVILNGYINGRNSGKFTFVSSTGCSVIDYFMISRDVLPSCHSLIIEDSITSPHMCIELSIEADVERCTGNVSKEIERDRRCVWNEQMTDIYLTNLRSGMTRLLPIDQIELVNVDVHTLTNMFTECVVDAASFMIRSCVRRGRCRAPWFDGECRKLRKTVKRLLRKYRRTVLEKDRLLFAAHRNQLKSLVRNKKSQHREASAAALCKNVQDSRLFWSQVRQISYRHVPRGTISRNVWFEHFVSIFRSMDCDAKSGNWTTETSNTGMEQHMLNCDISGEEIVQALASLKCGKAPGLDQISGEMLKCSAQVTLPLLTTMFNAIFTQGQIPEIWSKSVIVPIYKGGNLDDPDNYRGISLISVLCKLFFHIVNNRLMEWLEDSKLIGEEQAGFRRGYSTMDNIFTVHCIVERYLFRRKKVYMAFIDFKKAFDTVNRKALFEILNCIGLTGKMYKILRSLYDSVKSCVRCPDGLTGFFECKSGLRQGCKCSPALFAIVVHQVAIEVIKKGKHGIQLMPDVTTLFLLMFADDIVLMSDTVVGLQNQLDSLTEAASKVGLNVNHSKSKVVVFRMGGHLSAHEKWFIERKSLEVVNEYKYLGYVLTTKLCTGSTMSASALRAKAGMIQIMRTLRRLQCISTKVVFKLFDAQIQPTLLYGSEIWGVENCETIEKIQLAMLKYLLRVPTRAPNLMAYGDTGRHPLYINAILRSIKYWLKIQRMNEDRYPYKAYKMMIINVDTHNNWATKIRKVLIKYGFENVWNSQGVENEKEFLKECRDRMILEYQREWVCKIGASDRYQFYRSFKWHQGAELYLTSLRNERLRNILIRFRMGLSELYIHQFRFRKDVQCLLCPTCTEKDEDEIHFLFLCPAYEDLRRTFLSTCYGSLISDAIVQIFSSCDEDVVKKVALYIYYAFRRRREAVQMDVKL